MSRLSVVTVTHDSAHVLPTFFAALGTAPDGCEVVVVDSGSREPETVRALAEGAGARFVAAGRNVGYGSGSNRGAAVAHGEWLAFVNPDVEISWTSLLRLADLGQERGLTCVGPQLEDGLGRDVPSGHPFMRPPWVRRSTAPRAHGPVSVTDVVSGCALVVRRADFVAVGGFDESFFMFAEEHDLQRRVHDAGGTVGVAREVRARTVGGASSESVSRRWSVAERSVGHVRYMRKHHGRLVGALDLAYRLVLALVRTDQRPAAASLAQILRARPLRTGPGARPDAERRRVTSGRDGEVR
ncbi:glycosyltransferase family 2 protein [Cellulomonas cellasea]|uniref:Glycosyltransferase 2-like domain-containing protein n=2 Tax=Cellulomonas cellasea TaxID=43670 RepID=A0A0A0B8G8_9CELL|nr:glycosyltransferase [Cellulomonas cellasea]KGM02114.1 hypothetical protein Q760_15365 [Cellulomonas cellasea DSM 20118]GEA89833.1 hypothetical protein CCE01nite_37820 [Cellulomonas cellasea]